MYVTRVPNGSSPPAVLLRESYRDGGKVKTRTLANLTDWPDAKIEALRRFGLVEDLNVARLLQNNRRKQRSNKPNRMSVAAITEADKYASCFRSQPIGQLICSFSIYL